MPDLQYSISLVLDTLPSDPVGMSLKRALLVGIDRYQHMRTLTGCVNDIAHIEKLLREHEDGTPNFECTMLRTTRGVAQKKTGSRTRTPFRGGVTRRELLKAMDDLLGVGPKVVLFYFCGHGAHVDGDVILCTSDADAGGVDMGVPLSTLLGKVGQSKVDEVVIVLDCCYSGGAGGVPVLGNGVALIREGVTLLTAARNDQIAQETDDKRGVFSTLFEAALKGGAADVCGSVNAAGIYAYLSESLGRGDQRPTFKANLDTLHELRRCKSAVPLADLRKLPRIFDDPKQGIRLDPSYEHTSPTATKRNVATFSLLQRCRAAKLVEPVGTEHMYYAAMEKKLCRLTPLGQHYWRLASEGLL